MSSGEAADSHIVENQPFDEAYDVDDQEEVASSLAVTPNPVSSLRESLSNGLNLPDQPIFESEEEQESESDADTETPGDLARDTPPDSPGTPTLLDESADEARMMSMLAKEAMASTKPEDDSASEEYSSSLESSDDEETTGPLIEGAYNPETYAGLPVKPEEEELFHFISAYEPQLQELDTKLKPFIPDYIPAVGDIDAFIKIPRPDDEETLLGLDVVDEPCADQSNPTVLDLHLRTIAKTTTSKVIKRNALKDAEQNPKAIDDWIRSIQDVHRDKQPQTVHYTSKMPDVDTLMQAWPEGVEDILSKLQLPSAELDVPLDQYVDIVCALFDIPVQKSRIQALHLLMTLFIEFRNSQHFGGNLQEDDANFEEDHLVL